tara:strand:+ start:1979 stop:2392 length:414 start_codon:yes stop_codon:yes gene_type:complete
MIAASVLCLAMNIYHEARGENLAGQMAVGFSTLNRVNDKRYPDSVCDVVHQARYSSWDPVNPIKHKCQYSWFCDGLSDTPHDGKAMLEATILAQNIYYGRVTDISEGATHYHATYVNPYWASSMTQVLSINDHIFYR